MQEQQFAAQQKENEEKAMRHLKEQFQERMVMVERQLAEQKQQVRNGESPICFYDYCSFTVLEVCKVVYWKFGTVHFYCYCFSITF